MKIRTDKKYGVGVTNPKHQMEIKCLGCSNSFFIDTEFEFNLIGVVQFRCKRCGAVFTLPDGMWANVTFADPNQKLEIQGGGNVGI